MASGPFQPTLSFNERDWIYRTGCRTGGNIDGLNRKENVSVSVDRLHIAVLHELIVGKLENTGGDVIVRTEPASDATPAARGIRSRNYAGTLHTVCVYNRALEVLEIAALGNPR